MSEDDKRTLNLYNKGVYKVENRDSSGGIATYKMIGIEDEKPISIQFMTEDEKAEKGLSPDMRIQVLDRDKNGKIIAYRIIKSDSDVVTKY